MNVGTSIENSGVNVRSYDRVINFAHFNPRSSSIFVSFMNMNMFVQLSLDTKDL